MGAARVGYSTGWASRREGTFPPAMGQPDDMGEDLIEVLKGLMALPA